MVLLKIAVPWLFSWFKAVRKIKSYGFVHRNSIRVTSQVQHSLCSSVVTHCSLEGMKGQTMVCSFEGTLLRSSSLFPYFMLVAFEGGSLVRAFILLLSAPFLCLSNDLSVGIMTFICFCGLKTKDMNIVARTVLPKFYLENMHLQAYEVLKATTGKRVVFTNMPRIMVDGFLREYLEVYAVEGVELQVSKSGYFTGFSICGSSSKQKGIKDLSGEVKADVALISPCNPHDYLFIAHSKESYLVDKDDPTSIMPRCKYPKPLIFHDGRLAFLPTPSSMLLLFLWLPIGGPLALFRIFIGLLPYKISLVLGMISGIKFRVEGLSITTPTKPTHNTHETNGVLYVCTHRTLMDPVMLGNALQRPVPAVTYSVSRISELLSPIRTVRLTRDRARDADTMRELLRIGDLVVCPEGTTCREPYLLRFSSLFAELADKIVPVAMDCKGSMFYGTTVTGMKWLDPVMFMMNPVPEYRVKFLQQVAPEMTMAGGRSAAEVANEIQKLLGDALGFECTALTRRDKYLMLAGNEGLVGGRG